MKILTNNEIPREKWNDFLKSNPFASPFQTPEFFDLFNSVNGLLAEAVAVKDVEEILALAVITTQKEDGWKSYFSRRAIIYGGPLVDPEYPEALEMLLKHIVILQKGNAIYFEIRNFSDYSLYKMIFINQGFKYIPYLNFKISCSDETIIWSNLNRLRKRQIKKAQSKNVIFGEAKGIKEVEELYSLLYDTYSLKIKKPLFEWGFFNNLYKSDFCKVFIVRAENKVIGGHFCLMSGDTIYDWYGCGLDNQYKDFAPSTLSVYSALKFGADNGYKYFDFMGAGTPDEQYGVRDFKAQFGGDMIEFGRFKLVLNPILYKIGKAGIALLSKFKK